MEELEVIEEIKQPKSAPKRAKKTQAQSAIGLNKGVVIATTPKFAIVKLNDGTIKNVEGKQDAALGSIITF